GVSRTPGELARLARIRRLTHHPDQQWRERRVRTSLWLPASRFRRRVEERFQGQFGGLGHFDGTRVVRPAGRLEQEKVRAGGEFQGRGRVADEFSVDKDFGGIGIGGYGDLAKTLGRRSRDGKRNRGFRNRRRDGGRRAGRFLRIGGVA